MSVGILPGSYCGAAPLPAQALSAWNLDPLLLVALLILGFALRRSPAGLAGVMVLVLAFVSPLCAVSVALFSARVVHHVLLVAVGLPLLGALLITAMVYGPPLARGERVAPGAPEVENQWLGGPRKATGELAGPDGEDSQAGGASGRW